MAKGAITGALSYTALQGAFAKELAIAAEQSLAPVWVLVPTNLVALRLRRELARRTGGAMGIQFLTLKDAARRMALPWMALQGCRPLPTGSVELVLQRLLEDVPEGSYLAAFKQFTNGAPAIARAIRILEDCLWTPEALEEATGSSQRSPAQALAAGDPAAPRRLGELAGIWARLRAWKQKNALFEPDDIVREAARQDREPTERPDILFLYGFYDFNPSQRSLVGRLIPLARRCSAYLLWAQEDGRPAPGFEYALPVVEWLKEVLGTEDVRCLPQDQDSDLGRLLHGIFRRRPLPPAVRRVLNRASAAFDGSVRVVSCPGELSEAIEVVRALLSSAQERGERQSAGILLRSPEEKAGLMAEALERAGIRCYMREGLPLTETIAGRIALNLLDLAAGDAERAAVVDFLSLADVDWPQGLSATALDRVARQAGLTRGHAEWRIRLVDRAAQLRRQSDQADEAERAACARDAELCAVAAGFLEEFFQKTAPLSSLPTWIEAARCLRGLLQEYAPSDDEATAPVLEVIDELGALDVTHARPDVRHVRWVLGRRLVELSLKRERFQHVGPALSSIMGARGVTFDVLIVPGLVEKSFPRHVPEQSLLTELDREALNSAAHRLGCGELPLQKRRPDEERYLFRIAVGSAGRAIVLTYPRLEQDSGRPRIPSRFLTEACSALAGWSVSASMLDEGLPAGLVERVPLNRRGWTPEQLKLALDELEYDAAVFTGPAGTSKRRAYMAAVSETFRQAAQMDQARWRQRDFGPYDGKIRAEDLLERLRARYSRFGSPVSPTRFETYARCPFEYFLTHVLEIKEVEAPSEELELPGLERGSLVHDLLRQLYEQCLNGRALGELSDGEIEAIVATGAGILEQLGRIHARNHPATWTAERERTMDQLKALLTHERTRHSEARPTFFEYEISFPEPFALRVGTDDAVTFKGRIDRIDSLADGAIQVVDYKTGSPGRYKPDCLLGGTQLQLPVYLLAASRLLKAKSASALYLMVSEPRDVREFTLEQLNSRMEDFRKALRLIVEGIAAGDFFPLPAEAADARGACDMYCRYGMVCGAARRSLAEMKQTDPDAARLAALRRIE